MAEAQSEKKQITTTPSLANFCQLLCPGEDPVLAFGLDALEKNGRHRECVVEDPRVPLLPDFSAY